MNDNRRSVFVGSLSYATTDATLALGLGRFGGIESARVVLDRESLGSKGFGFAVFRTVDGARAAAAAEEMELDGRSISIGMARPKSDRPRRLVGIKEPLITSLVATSEGLRVVTSLELPRLAVTADNIQLNILPTYALSEPTLVAGISEFEELLNSSPSASESAWQDFFVRHPEVLPLGDIKSAHPHLILRDVNRGTELVPDFILQPLHPNRLPHLLELKLPRAAPFVGLGSQRPYLSADFRKAHAQLTDYQEFFNAPTNREWFHDKYGFQMFRPEMILIMGRNVRLGPIERKKLNSELDLWTFDEVLENAKRRR